MKQGVAILGIFAADLAFRANRQPGMGETLIGSGFKMGPGGKGSNQAVAAGISVTRLGTAPPCRRAPGSRPCSGADEVQRREL